jgi:antirestriction protein ArdC
MSKSKELMQSAALQIVSLMQSEGENWSKPWIAKGVPSNVVSGKAYRGFNNIWLSFNAYQNSYTSNSWATFKQWKEKGATVKKGEKAVNIFFFSTLEKEKDNGEKERFGFWKYYNVFNASQVEGYQEPTTPKNDHLGLASVDCFIANTGADITHGGDRACFVPKTDQIFMPELNDFNSVEEYYSTILHELTHWTGHKSRLNRFELGHDKEEYAREELVAECGAAFLCVLLGVNKAPTPSHAQYLNNWIAAIKNDYRALFTAISQAQKAVDYLDSLQDSMALPMAAE